MVEKDPSLDGASTHCVAYLELRDAVKDHIVNQSLPVLGETAKPLGSERWQVSNDVVRHWGDNPDEIRTDGEELEFLNQGMSAVELIGEGEDSEAEEEDFDQDFSL